LGFSAVVRIGKKLIVDTGYPGMTTEGIEHVKKAITILEKDYEVVVTNEGGHLDSVFCPIKQGHIISSHWGVQQLYDETFPGWKVFWIEKQTNKNSNGKWWTEENNFYSPIFNEHVNQKASEWVGDSTETVFEANMLVVDEHNVICIAGHEQSFEKFKQLGITPHVVDFPTRYFWDGGIHCLTVDIRRTGGCLDYFQ
jgi:N-dimethylarginine dimethylaminohydrolase